MALEQMLRFIEAKEAGKRLATQLLLPHTIDAVAGNTHAHQKKGTAEEPLPKNRTTAHTVGENVMVTMPPLD